MNCYNKLLLWRPRRHNYSVMMMVIYGDSARDHGCYSSFSSNANGWRNTIKQRNHLLLLLTFKAYPQHHLCTTSKHLSIDQSVDNNNRLPDSIEQQCGKWAKILPAEWEAQDVKYIWMETKLKCTKVQSDFRSSILHLSSEELNPERLRNLRQLFRVGRPVELKILKQHFPHQKHQSNPSIGPDSPDNLLLGTIIEQRHSRIILIYVKRCFDGQERERLQRCYFDIKKAMHPFYLESQMAFLEKRHSLWCKWPGYGAMLQSFKCQQPLLQEEEYEDTVDTELDRVVGSSNGNQELDPSQRVALSAALNLKQRPIVAVHGAPGTGKTHLLAEYLRLLSQQGKRVLVHSPNLPELYTLLDIFCKNFAPSTSGPTRPTNFLCMKRFDAELASKIVDDEAIESIIEARSNSLASQKDEETWKHYGWTTTLKTSITMMEDTGSSSSSSSSGKQEDHSIVEQEEAHLKKQQETEGFFNQMNENNHALRDKATGRLLQNTSILFTIMSNSLLNLFTRIGHTFDVVIIDNAHMSSEFESWWIALPTAPAVRLFGDYNQPGIPVRSPLGREFNLKRSLLQRLDEQLGPEVNFHLRRQYRSNAAIQAWSNRAFYGQWAAEADESVRNIRVDDLLEEEGKSSPAPPPPESLITEPLVLVDLGQLEGSNWRDWMFQPETGGKSRQNWGEALLTAAHLWHLFEYIPQLPSSNNTIAYLTRYDAQRNLIWKIFSALFERHLQKLDQVRIENHTDLFGQQFEVLIKDSVIILPPERLINLHHLKHFNNEMCRARRQFIWFANSKWLEQGSEQSRLLLQTFRDHGRIVGPNQLLPLETAGQFREMIRKVKDNYWKMQERGMKKPIVRRRLI